MKFCQEVEMFIGESRDIAICLPFCQTSLLHTLPSTQVHETASYYVKIPQRLFFQSVDSRSDLSYGEIYLMK